jgi:hypothetical protein
MLARFKGPIVLGTVIFSMAMLCVAQMGQTPSTAITVITQPSPTPIPPPSPTPTPTPFPTPTPSPTPPPACTNPLASLDPVALGLDTTVEDPIMTPTDDTDPVFSAYTISGSLSSATIAGVVLPAYGNYTISPNATMTADLNYDVSGCWGPYGAMVFADPGLYTFLALGSAPIPTPTPVATTAATAHVEQAGGTFAAAPPAVVLGAALAPKESDLCFSDPAALARAKSVEYPPLAATVAGGKTGLAIDDTNDAAIQLAQKVLTSQTIQFEKIGGTNPAVDDMVSNIGTVFGNNAKKPIVAVEIGHGSPNTWTNVGSIFQLNYGTTPATPSDALKSLEKGAVGQIATFDVFSCFVAKGVAPLPKGALNPNHILAHLAGNLVAGAAQVDTRGVNVPIFIISPVAKRAGTFALKNTDPDTKNAATATVSCKGPAPPTCTVKVTELLK